MVALGFREISFGDGGLGGLDLQSGVEGLEFGV